MADPHNVSRYGELWPQYKIDAMLAVLEELQEFIVLSGGWAWHFMSPAGHPEYKHAHDHKDADIFVPPSLVATAVALIKGPLGFPKARTIYDKHSKSNKEEFRRYEKLVEDGEHPPFRLTIDFFVGTVPTRTVEGGWLVVDPATLLTFYKRAEGGIQDHHIHSSDLCFSVVAAKKLLDAGIDPVGRPELVEIPDAKGERRKAMRHGFDKMYGGKKK